MRSKTKILTVSNKNIYYLKKYAGKTSLCPLKSEIIVCLPINSALILLFFDYHVCRHSILPNYPSLHYLPQFQACSKVTTKYAQHFGAVSHLKDL